MSHVGFYVEISFHITLGKYQGEKLLDGKSMFSFVRNSRNVSQSKVARPCCIPTSNE